MDAGVAGVTGVAGGALGGERSEGAQALSIDGSNECVVPWAIATSSSNLVRSASCRGGDSQAHNCDHGVSPAMDMAPTCSG